MNPNRTTSDENRFDLLVDGELGESDRQELLSRLDHEPDGWRHCALAFLEAQAWKQVLGPMAAKPAEPNSSKPPKAASASRRSWWSRPIGRSVTALAMAASFAAALLIGWQVQNAWRSGGMATGPQVSEVAVQGTGGSHAVKAEMVGEQSGETPSLIPEQPGTTASDVYVVDWPGAAASGSRPQAIRLPVVERNKVVGHDLYEGLPAPIAPELLQELEQAGLQVQQQRGLLPLKMEDGRRLVVPVDDVNIQYVGKPTL